MARPTRTWLAVGLLLAVTRLHAATTPCSFDRAADRLPCECGGWQGGRTTREDSARSEMWWRGDAALSEFGIEKGCSDELETIFQRTLPILKTAGADVVRKEDALKQLLANASTTNESAVVQAVEDLEAARRTLARTFTMMQYYMYLRLTSSQRAKVHEYLYRHVERSESRPTPR